MGKSINQFCSSNSNHKWLVLVCVLFQSLAFFSTALSFGALFVAILDKYKEGRSKTAVVQSLFVGFSVTPGVLTGLLVARFGVIKVTITGSVVTSLGFILSYFASSVFFIDICVGVFSGLGVSFTYISGAVVIGYTFSGSQRMLAMTLQGASVSLGIVLIPYILDWLLDMYGLNGTFLVLGGFLLNGIPIAIVFYFGKSIVHRTKPKQTLERIETVSGNSAPSNTIDIQNSNHTIKIAFVSRIATYASEIITVPYILVVTGSALVVCSLNAYMIIVVDVFVWKGYSIKEGMISFIPYGIFGFIARIIPGLAALKQDANSAIAPIIFCFGGFMGFISVYVSENYYLNLLGTGLAGFSVGGVLSSATVLIIEIINNTRHIGVAIGLLFTMIGLFTSGAGPFYGFVRDSTGSYSIVLLISAGIQGLGMVIYIIVLILKRRLSLVRNDDIVIER